MIPICKLCESRHWTWDEHALKGTEELQKVGAAVLRKSPVVPTMSPQEPLSPPDVPTYRPVPENCACGRKREPRRTVCSACRKKAYRERSK